MHPTNYLSNNYLFDKNKLCFTHIPKSGETTL